MSLAVSFEFFPPRNDEMEAQLWRSIGRLAPLQPSFVSVTYGAGGSTRERTHSTIKRILAETNLKPAAHLTCVGTSRAEVDEIVRGYWQSGVKHIVALRGDMPEPGPYAQVAEGYESTPDLIRGIRKVAPFEVSVSAYPEKHPDSPSVEHDYALLKAKIDAGANRAISPYAIGGRRLAHLLLSPRVVDFLETALTTGDKTLNIDDVVVGESGAVGKTIETLQIGSRSGATVLAVVRDGVPTASPRRDFTLRAGDHLLVLGTAEQLKAVEQLR